MCLLKVMCYSKSDKTSCKKNVLKGLINLISQQMMTNNQELEVIDHHSIDELSRRAIDLRFFQIHKNLSTIV